jgi:hypothetical protein
VHTAEQVSRLRHVLLPPARKAAFSAALSAAEQGDGNTHAGNMVIYRIPRQVKAALAKPTPAQRFDALFALTFALNVYDNWMQDNECWEEGGECEKAVAVLAKAWQALLLCSNDELGIDASFSRPGVEALLMKFANTLASVEREGEPYDLDWR